jgi:hypothetical protein
LNVDFVTVFKDRCEDCVAELGDLRPEAGTF